MKMLSRNSEFSRNIGVDLLYSSILLALQNGPVSFKSSFSLSVHANAHYVRYSLLQIQLMRNGISVFSICISLITSVVLIPSDLLVHGSWLCSWGLLEF